MENELIQDVTCKLYLHASIAFNERSFESKFVSDHHAGSMSAHLWSKRAITSAFITSLNAWEIELYSQQVCGCYGAIAVHDLLMAFFVYVCAHNK